MKRCDIQFSSSTVVLKTHTKKGLRSDGGGVSHHVWSFHLYEFLDEPRRKNMNISHQGLIMVAALQTQKACKCMKNIWEFPNHHPPTSNQPPPTHQPTTTNHHEPPTTTKCLLLCPVKLLTCGVIRSYNCALRCLNLCMVRLREPVAWGEEACWCKFGVLLGRLAAPTMLKVTVLYLVCCTLCNCVCDVAVPCGFARPQWEVR